MKIFIRAMLVASLFVSSGISLVYGARVKLGHDATAITYASELISDSTILLSASTSDSTYPDVVETPLGSSIEAGQQAYIRFDLVNAAFATRVSDGTLRDMAKAIATPETDGATSGFGDNTSSTAGVTIVSGGQEDDTCVVYQVAGRNGISDNGSTVVTGNQASDPLVWIYPDLKVTQGNLSIKASYTLHETIQSADCDTGSQGARLTNSVTGTIINYAPSLVFNILEEPVVTADVHTLYVSEIDLKGSNRRLRLGGFVTDIVGTNRNPATREGVLRGQLIDAATITVEGDFSAAGTVTLVDTTGGGSCNDPIDPLNVVATATIADDRQSAKFFDVGIDTGVYDRFPTGDHKAYESYICYNVDGSTPIVTSDYTVSIELTPVAGVSKAEFAPRFVGRVQRNGSILKASFISEVINQIAFVELLNTSNAPAPYTVICYSDKGSSQGVSATVPARSSKHIRVSALGCPSQQDYNAVQFIFTTPPGAVVGSVVRENVATSVTFQSDMTGNQ